jgi:hypothetical protein
MNEERFCLCRQSVWAIAPMFRSIHRGIRQGHRYRVMHILRREVERTMPLACQPFATDVELRCQLRIREFCGAVTYQVTKTNWCKCRVLYNALAGLWTSWSSANICVLEEAREMKVTVLNRVIRGLRANHKTTGLYTHRHASPPLRAHGCMRVNTFCFQSNFNFPFLRGCLKYVS